jgi:hypothetical protein
MNIFKDNIDWQFAAYEDRETQKMVNKIMVHNLQVLCHEIIETIPNVVSIYLTGGYVASEGCILVNKDTINILSDYDLVVIINGKSPSPVTTIPENTLAQLKNIYKMPGHPIGELIIWDLKELKNLAPSKFLFDFRLAKCIYGEEIGKLVPLFSVKDIPSTDGLRLIFNRIFGAIIPFSPSFIINEPTLGKKRHITFESAKLVMGSCEALLMLEGELTFTQRENIKRFKEIFLKNSPSLLLEKMPSIQELVEKSLEYRLIPNYKIEKNAVNMWLNSRDFVLLALEHYLAVDNGMKNTDLKVMIKNFIEHNPHPFILNIIAVVNVWRKYSRIKLKLLCKKPYNALLAIRIFLLCSVRRDGTFDKPSLNEARNILAEHMGIELSTQNPSELWDLLKHHTLQNYLDPFIPVKLSFMKQIKKILIRR